VHDLTMLRESGLLTLLHHNVFILADPGYNGESQIITPSKPSQAFTPDQKLVNKLLNGHRALVENIRSRLKNWRCLSVPWRHSLHLHPAVFWLICQITNIDLFFRPIRAQ
jgi:hypothetical protein